VDYCGLTTRVEMVNKCSVFGCRSGYDSCADVDKRITFHSFPRDIQLREKWIKANPRKDFVPSKNSRMCSLHFRDDDFVEQHCDTNSSRRNQASSTELKKRYLKPDAVPSIFVNAPAYLSSPATTPRSSASVATASGRRQKEASRLLTQHDAFTADDVITSLTLQQLKDRLATETTVPGGYHVALVEDVFVVYRLCVTDAVPRLQGSLTVSEMFDVSVHVDGRHIQSAEYRDIVPGSLETMSQLLNLLARVKAWCEVVHSRPADRFPLQSAVSCLQEHADTLDDGCDEHRTFSFILEQTKLAMKSKFKRHYSPQLTVYEGLYDMIQSRAVILYPIFCCIL